MNFATISALIMAIVVFVYGLILSSDSLVIFYDFPSLFIVFGGVIAAAAISFQYQRIWTMIKFSFARIIKGKKTDYSAVIEEIIKGVDLYRKGTNLKDLSEQTNDLFYREGLQLLESGVMSPDQVFEIMDERNENLYYLHSEDASKVKVIGKYPPAFGMMGTTIGMIVLLANLNGADAIKKVGPAMGVCLITTLYGTVLANFGFLPLADNIVEQSKEQYLKNKIIVEGLKLLFKKENPIFVAEKLNSFLLPSQRLDWKTVLGK